MNLWSQLRSLSKLDQLAETIVKTAFLLSENHHVIQSYLNHKGAHFKVVNRVGKNNVGRDLEASLDSTRLLLEVKGLSNTLGSIELTPNEYKHSTQLNYRLCIIENALDTDKSFSVFQLDKA